MARVALSLAILALTGGEASAQSAAARKAARELVDFLKSRFAREVAEEGAGKVEQRFAQSFSKFGHDSVVSRDLVKAARQLGPRTALDAVTKHGAPGARILAEWGERGSRLLATKGPAAMRVHASLGDEGIALMIRKHGTLTSAYLPELSPAIAASGRQRDLLAVLEKYGDRACAFLWRNKGVMIAGTALAAFLANPEPYLKGVEQLAAAPIGHIAGATDWTSVFLLATALAAGLAAFRMLLLRRARPVANSAADV